MKKNNDDGLGGCANIINVIAIVIFFFFSFYYWYNEVKPTNLGGFIQIIFNVIVTTAIFGMFAFWGGIFLILTVLYLGIVIFLLNYSWEFFEPKTFIGFMFFTFLALIEIGLLIVIPAFFIYSVNKEEE